MAAQAEGNCQQCVKFALTTYTLRLEGDLSNFLNDKVKQDHFFMTVSGLLNEKGGLLVIHAENLNQLGDFDQKVDNKLQALIPDGRLYSNVFERFTMPEHVIFRVKPNLGKTHERLYSTFNFNTKISVNMGKANPSYTQMSTLIGDCYNAEPPRRTSSQSPVSSIEFPYLGEVQIKRGSTCEPFQESMTMQAKTCELDCSSYEDLVNYCWNTVKVNEYISAFAKINEGGTVLIGVFEEKLKTDKWLAAEADFSRIGEVKDAGWGVWKDSEAPTPSMYHVVKEGAVPQREVATGKFKCIGVKLRAKYRRAFTTSIRRKVKENLLWYGAEPPVDPVSIVFHTIPRETEELCVIEIRVKYYHGICFHVHTGPECYRSTLAGSQAHFGLDKVSLAKWMQPFLRQLGLLHEEDDDMDEEDDTQRASGFQVQDPVFSR